MTWTRRQTLLGLMGSAGIAVAAGCSRGGGSTSSSTTGTTGTGGGGQHNLRFSWWGNELRDRLTNEVVDLYVEQNPGVSIEATPSEFGAYWDRLATQTAGGDMPDVIQMADGFMAEYGSRGSLLDLEPYVDTSKFAPGTVDVGRLDGTLVGINLGINTPTIMCNTGVLEAAGIELPDDTTWTWDDYLAISAEISAATPEGTYGSASPGTEGPLRAWVRQNGGELFLESGELGTTVDVLRGYFELLAEFKDSGAIPPGSVIVEESAKPLEQTAVVLGASAFQVVWTNQFNVVSSSSEDDIVMLRMPSVTGNEADLHAWYHPSQLWSASARTADPEAAGAFIDWLVNSVEVGAILLDERGRPCNTEVLAQIEESLSPEGKEISQFLSDLEPGLGEPQPVPPPGAGQVLGEIMSRAQDDLYFGDIDAAAAAQRFYDESIAVLGG
ncbi:ABC transporter substrate-binding protein [Pseudactinotalea terrae]|uniref:ABC transporter substrate-binding protein n=1 Tax=Pseudactinotalea terrae TaxID=1743262 RepID=UPI001391665C|nr:extracellular solute-binding protein [Pseudactinotalea terrae]